MGKVDPDGNATLNTGGGDPPLKGSSNPSAGKFINGAAGSLRAKQHNYSKPNPGIGSSRDPGDTNTIPTTPMYTVTVTDIPSGSTPHYTEGDPYATAVANGVINGTKGLAIGVGLFLLGPIGLGIKAYMVYNAFQEGDNYEGTKGIVTTILPVTQPVFSGIDVAVAYNEGGTLAAIEKGTENAVILSGTAILAFAGAKTGGGGKIQGTTRVGPKPTMVLENTRSLGPKPTGGPAPPVNQQILGKSSSSAILGKNLETVGIGRPANSAAHHMVAGNDPRAAVARSILQKEGIDINEADNGVFLPKSSKFAQPNEIPHSKIHTDKYYQNITTRLQNATDVRAELNLIRMEILNGTFQY